MAEIVEFRPAAPLDTEAFNTVREMEGDFEGSTNLPMRLPLLARLWTRALWPYKRRGPWAFQWAFETTFHRYRVDLVDRHSPN
jgi:hypothetical protein